MKFLSSIFGLLCIIVAQQLNAQDVSLFQQYNGRYDYTAIGNTLNSFENGSFADCVIQTSSSADLNLLPSQTVIAAYLYWAGSDAGDFDITLNGIPISAERTFSDALDASRIFFAAFADVTSIIQSQGNGTYTIADFDLTAVIAPYCPTGTNFGGWAIAVIYEDLSLPLNQLNVYDGLQSVPTSLTITLDNLNVLDNEDAKIGFIAWEGDQALAVNEQLSINGNPISNPPLNPVNNAFNGTNSFTGANNLYNMDIDVYDIQNNISIGDTSATITLTSGQDFVMINNVITVLNSQLPDGTISINNYTLNCGDRTIDLDYTIYNTNSTAVLPSNTPIAFYADGMLIGQTSTVTDIPIDGNETGSISLLIPDTIGDNFDILAFVDDDGSGNSTVVETNENNNTDIEPIALLVIPEIQVLPSLLACNEGFQMAMYDLIEHTLNHLNVDINAISFFTSLENLENETNAILIPENYTNTSDPQTIYIRVVSPPCYEIYQFNLETENCPPTVPDGFSPNDDSKNDWFNIQGLYDIFTEHKLLIYNRLGTLIFEGDNTKPWNGFTNRGINNKGKLVPVGTYYYVLYLNDPEYRPRVGWVYVNY